MVNKETFQKELKEILQYMTEEEINQTLEVLNNCKPRISQRSCQDKCEKARYLSGLNGCKAALHFSRRGGVTGQIHILGATILHELDFDKYKSLLPDTEDKWWLENGMYVCNNKAFYNFNPETGKVRPLLVIDCIEGALHVGEVFYLSDEKFRLISPSLAIRSACLEGELTFPRVAYNNSGIRFCVDGWLQNLIGKNKQTEPVE